MLLSQKSQAPIVLFPSIFLLFFSASKLIDFLSSQGDAQSESTQNITAAWTK